MKCGLFFDTDVSFDPRSNVIESGDACEVTLVTARTKRRILVIEDDATVRSKST